MRLWQDAWVFAVQEVASYQKEQLNIVENVGSLQFWLKHSLYMMSVTTTGWCPVALHDQEVTVYDNRFSGDDFHLSPSLAYPLKEFVSFSLYE